MSVAVKMRADLAQRADFIAAIRLFFKERGVMEVTTPVLSQATTPDPALISFQTTTGEYLHTSPEFAMKRLLAQGSGDIYQIAPVFRQEELGRWHRPEFSMLEWYRVGWDHLALIEEVIALIEHVLPISSVEHYRYQAVFQAYLDLPSVQQTPLSTLQSLCQKHLHATASNWHRSECLDALLDGVVMPHWQKKPCVVLLDYPHDQAALAEIDHSVSPPVAKRFEVFVHGIECANGFCELTDPVEQRARFEKENQMRAQPVVLDEAFLKAMECFPACAGVALGLDRLFALSLGKEGLVSYLS